MAGVVGTDLGPAWIALAASVVGGATVGVISIVAERLRASHSDRRAEIDFRRQRADSIRRMLRGAGEASIRYVAARRHLQHAQYAYRTLSADDPIRPSHDDVQLRIREWDASMLNLMRSVEDVRVEALLEPTVEEETYRASIVALLDIPRDPQADAGELLDDYEHAENRWRAVIVGRIAELEGLDAT